MDPFSNALPARLARRLRPHVRPYVLRRAERLLRARGALDFRGKLPPGAFPPDAGDLLHLYRLVRRHRPRTVIEFGSGCSTPVLARALHDVAVEDCVPAGRLYSLDTSAEWLEITASYLAPPLTELVEFRHAPVDIVEHRGTRVFRHRNVPHVAVDMLYLDSPPLIPHEVEVAIDPLDLEPLFASTFIGVIDGREINARYLQQHLTRRYDFRFHWILWNTTFRLIDPA